MFVLVALGAVISLWLTARSPQPPPIVSKRDTFAFPLFHEPHSLDPLKETSTTARYLIPSLHRGLMFYRDGDLHPAGAKECHWISDILLVCTLNQEVHYSSGERILAQDYLRTFALLLNSENAHPLAELLFPLKNAKAIVKGDISFGELGVIARDDETLEFFLEKPMKEFIYNLAHPLLSPRPEKVTDPDYGPSGASNLPTTGPYKVSRWTPGQKLELTPNPFFKPEPPALPVEILFVEDDATNFRLYKQGRLDWLRRLPTHEIPAYRNDPAFVQIPLARFDYIGFGPQLADKPLLRKALVHSLNYQQLADIYHALGRPGCPSLPRSYLADLPCFEFDLELARKLYAEHLANEPHQPTLELSYSKLGGDDVEKGMVWMAEQWRMNLGVQVTLEPLEQGQMLHRLWQNLPTIYRKGVSLDRPTCAAAIEIFGTEGSERFLNLKAPDLFDKYLPRLLSAPDASTKAEVCTQAIQTLLDTYALIPLGEIHFTMLISPKFEGVYFNELNQLDLSRLRKADP